MMTDDMALVHEYATMQSERAFGTLVERHVSLVHSAAVRQVGDVQLAQDITQAVFIILARKARSLGPGTILSLWLYRTTRYAAADALKAQRRRQQREQEAYMQSRLLEDDQTDSAWAQLAPLLDEAMAQLRDRDRAALFLHYFQNKTAAEVAAALTITEAAAHKRVNRAVEKLRRIFARRGLATTTAVITAAISANSVQAAPAGLAATITTVAAAKSAAAGTSTLSLVKGALKLMAWAKAKTAATVGVGVLLAAGTTTVTVREIQEHLSYPWQVNESRITQAQLNQPPQVRIVPSKFHQPAEAIMDVLVGTGLSAQEVVAASFGSFSSARAICYAKLPTRKYDYIATLRGGITVNEQALREEVERIFGVEGRFETLDTNVWMLKVKAPNSPSLKVNTSGGVDMSFSPISGGFRGENAPISSLAIGLEREMNIPIMDNTGLGGHYDFNFDCSKTDLAKQNWDKVDQALDKLGLELVLTNLPLKMLVVERVRASARSSPREVLLGPSDPGAEEEYDYWYQGAWFQGADGSAYLSIDEKDPNSGSKDFMIGNSTAGTENRKPETRNSANWRSQMFRLGPAAGGAEPMTFSFAYKLPGNVNPGDNVSVSLRFFDDTATNFVGAETILLGSHSGDSRMSGYKTVTLPGIRATNTVGSKARATLADVWVTCNLFHPWTSGDARFDDFSVTTRATHALNVAKQ